MSNYIAGFVFLWTIPMLAAYIFIVNRKDNKYKANDLYAWFLFGYGWVYMIREFLAL